ncbi:TrlF family AAA-like ATPase [Chloroflexota bacterium]
MGSKHFQNDNRGSIWDIWDLHFHTPSSYEYDNESVSNEMLVKGLVDSGIRVVAVTDHHKMDIKRIRDMQSIAGDSLTIFPGIELRDDHGGHHYIHYIGIFAEDCDLEHVWSTLKGTLRLTNKGVSEKGGNECIYIPIETGAELIHDLGGVISIHAGTKSNSIEEIANIEQYKQQIKYNITNEFVDLMEIGQLKDQDDYRNIVFPDTGLSKPLIMCSDCHDIKKYQFKTPCWIKANPTFLGLCMAIQQPEDRVFLGDKPPQLIRIEQNKTKYIKSISFSRKQECPEKEMWFEDHQVLFNPGLVAIVGNKGSGKSALTDTIGLLGATKNFNSFSFLTEDRFKHPLGRLADFFTATLTWESGDNLDCCLSKTIALEEVERLKYLPQKYVEQICNELEEENFERELKSVIFSHIPDTQRLGHKTFDKLLQYKTEEKQKRVDSLIKQLREHSRNRSLLESENNPIVRRNIKEKIKQREIELKAHKNAKPKEIADPASTGSVEPNSKLLSILKNKEEEKQQLIQKFKEAEDAIKKEERRLAAAMRLIEKLSNFEKDFLVFKNSLKTDIEDIGVELDDLLSLTVNKDPIKLLIEEISGVITANKNTLGDEETYGLIRKLKAVDKNIEETQLQLDAPYRKYQVYLRQLQEWHDKQKEILGDESSSESLNGLKAILSDLDKLPAEIEAIKKEQISIALEIHKEKLDQVHMLQDFYKPVQSFISSHKLAKDKISLDFRTELVNENFSNSLIALISQNRRGSFMGIDEGYAMAEQFARQTDWQDVNSVRNFLNNVDEAFHYDKRERRPSVVQISDQVLKGKAPDDLFNLLYGLEYIRPKYSLHWDGKDLSMLSPGERGTLLLVFYLLIEKGDTPILIDQPEGNLDNLTIANNLVDCIKAARAKRQVFIVTHNPNLAVVCDADQIIYSEMDKAHGNAITYTTGALENIRMIEHVTDVLEGTLPAFHKRGNVYKVTENR